MNKNEAVKIAHTMLEFYINTANKYKIMADKKNSDIDKFLADRSDGYASALTALIDGKTDNDSVVNTVYKIIGGLNDYITDCKIELEIYSDNAMHCEIVNDEINSYQEEIKALRVLLND